MLPVGAQLCIRAARLHGCTKGGGSLLGTFYDDGAAIIDVYTGKVSL